MPWDIYGAGAGPWIAVEQGLIWLDDVLLKSPVRRGRHPAV